jgi:antitoxin VapB
MALSIKDPLTERLAAEVASMAGESKTRAVRVALEERRARLALAGLRRDRGAAVTRMLEEEIWSHVPADVLGVPLTKAERETILGYGPEGA